MTFISGLCLSESVPGARASLTTTSSTGPPSRSTGRSVTPCRPPWARLWASPSERPRGLLTTRISIDASKCKEE